MRTIHCQVLTPQAFAPYGEVLDRPAGIGRLYYERALANDRPRAWPSLSLTRTGEASELPLEAQLMERHPLSSQSFVPLDPARLLIIVAPHDATGRPDTSRAAAFLAAPGQGVTYRANVWHHPLRVLAAAAGFAVFMWRDGGSEDEEFVDVEPFRVATA